MKKPEKPPPVKFFTAVFYTDSNLLEIAKGKLIQNFGEIDYESPSFDFNFTDYYREEMGENIKRIFYSFKDLIMPDKIVDIKIKTSLIEDELAIDGKRRVNIDPGYMDYFKVVLASFKFGGQKVYLGKGVYADITLWYEKGKFKPLITCFPDFKSNIYEKVLLKIRELYKKDLRKRSSY